MTALRPEREGRPYEPNEPERSATSQDAYRQPDAFEAAVERLADPLTDPLPGQTPPAPAPGPYGQPGRGRRRGKPAQEGGGQGSPWFRPHLEPEAPSRPDPQSYGPQTAAYGQAHGSGYLPRPATAEPIAPRDAAPEAPAPPAPLRG